MKSVINVTNVSSLARGFYIVQVVLNDDSSVVVKKMQVAK